MVEKNIGFTFFLSETNLIKLYSDVPNILLDNAQKVIVKGSQEQDEFILEKVSNGNYFILPSDNQNYLFPIRNHRRINEHEYKTIKLLFDCQDYQRDKRQKFTLKKPAKISLTLNDKIWQLDEKGILYFTIDSNFSESLEPRSTQDKYEQIQEQLEQINTQLKLLEQENISLQSRLNESLQESDKIHQESIFSPLTLKNVSVSKSSTPKNPDVELFIRTTFTGFEGGLLLIAIISLFGTSLISTGFWILIFVGFIFCQYRQIISQNHLLITALTTLIVILLIPSLRTWLPIPSNLSNELTVFLLAILAGFLASFVIFLFQLIDKLRKT
ncbi:MAG: hypothetical protein RMX65_031335 [Nostoc sp. DedQUE01]|nr:hypothetical protein [Nostoc sp. DedQUE01]